MAVVARFEVISVKKFTAVTKRRINTNKGNPPKAVINSPNQIANPLVSKAFAKAIPPPKRRMIPQGSWVVSFQFNNAFFLFFEGNTNKSKPKAIAIIVSSNAGRNPCKRYDRLIQQNPAKAKTIATRFSS